MCIAQPFTQKTADHAGHHHTQVHQTVGKSVVPHLVLSGGDLLHHKKDESHEYKAISEIFTYDSGGDHPQLLRLEKGKQQIHHKWNIKNAGERKSTFFNPNRDT